MRRFLVDLAVVLRDLFWVFVATVLALTVVLAGGMAAHIASGPTVSLYVVNEGLAVLALALLSWLVLVGRHRYERRHR